jgi:hypothetical protein
VSRLNSILAWLCLASAALALPLAAEEITVTVPPDDPPAQTSTAGSTDAPPSSSALPTFAGGSKLSAPVSADASGATPTPPPESSTSDAPATEAPQQPAPPPQAGTEQTPPAASLTAPKLKAKKKKTAKAPVKPSPAAASADAPAATALPAATAPKHAKAVSASCKGLDETACGGNGQCIWVVGTPDAAGKGPKARCRSLAILKKEAKKADKSGKPDVLPWLQKTTATPADSAVSGTPPKAKVATKVKKAKTASAKPAAKPKEVAPPVPATTDDGQDGPASEAPASSDSQ